RRHVRRNAVGTGAHDHVAALLLRAAFEPVDMIPVDANVRQHCGLRHDEVRRDRRFPGAVRRGLCCEHSCPVLNSEGVVTSENARFPLRWGRGWSRPPGLFLLGASTFVVAGTSPATPPVNAIEIALVLPSPTAGTSECAALCSPRRYRCCPGGRPQCYAAP